MTHDSTIGAFQLERATRGKGAARRQHLLLKRTGPC